MDRRDFLIGAALAAVASPAQAAGPAPLIETIRGLEHRSAGRLGIAVRESGSGRRFDWRGDESFPMCSTFKILLAAALLDAAEQRRVRLGQRLRVRRTDLLPNSPFSESRAGATATVAELARAIVVDSDNAGANLLLPLIGGAAGLTGFARRLGDQRTRLDRRELEVGEAAPGDPRDTTTPSAMVADLDQLLVGDRLRPAGRQQLIQWMIACRTGKARLRAGFPAGWRAGDKTGSGANGTCNDVAIVWPKGGGRPLLIAAYLTGAKVAPPLRESILASVGHAIAAAGGNAFSPGAATRFRS